MRRLWPALVASALLAAGGAGDTSSPPVNVDVSRAFGIQSEVAIAADPRNPNVLLAGSNDYEVSTERVYFSTDGGHSWSLASDPPLVHRIAGEASDPVVGIDDRGRQYLGFIQVTGSDEAGNGRSSAPLNPPTAGS